MEAGQKTLLILLLEWITILERNMGFAGGNKTELSVSFLKQ